jgi:hypothetical protein
VPVSVVDEPLPGLVEPVLVDDEPLGEPEFVPLDWVPLDIVPLDWPVDEGELVWLPLEPGSLELPMLPLCVPLEPDDPVLADLSLLQPARARAAAPHTAMARVLKRFISSPFGEGCPPSWRWCEGCRPPTMHRRTNPRKRSTTGDRPRQPQLTPPTRPSR